MASCKIQESCKLQESCRIQESKKREGRSIKLHVPGMNDDLWARDRGLDILTPS